MHAEIIAVGSELTTGAKLDTNSQWLSLALAERGIPTHFHSTVADELPAMMQVLRNAVHRSDVVIISGGLGPTLDDLTRQALAELVQRDLVLHEPSLRHIEEMFARRNRPMAARNRVQAMFPEGSEPIPSFLLCSCMVIAITIGMPSPKRCQVSGIHSGYSSERS